MAFAVAAVAEGGDITAELILDIHRRLMERTSTAKFAGRIRDQQNWIGGSSYNPCSAAYVPPPPKLVGPLVDDLCAFCNSDDIPAVAQAAIAHAQFETIHPFVDGNGRTGRALIHLVLRRRGLSQRVVTPVSLILATRMESYLDGLTVFRHIGSPDTPAALDAVNTWIGRFAAACTRAVADAAAFEQQIDAVQADWRLRLGSVRRDSATDLLLRALPGAPVLTTNTAVAITGRTFAAANAAVDRLAEAGILRQTTVGRRNRAFESPDVIAAFIALERRLASPAADTAAASPMRPVPRRAR
jgi:Fic family protein